MGIIYYNKNLTEKAKFLRKHMTHGEIMLWQILKRSQCSGYTFHRQKPIGNYIVDFFSPSLQLVIEVDGPSHGDKQKYDNMRDEYLKKLGLHIMHFYEKDVYKKMDSILQIIYTYIADFEK